MEKLYIEGLDGQAVEIEVLDQKIEEQIKGTRKKKKKVKKQDGTDTDDSTGHCQSH